MTYLLDSHVFLWTAFSPRRLSRRSRKAIEDSGNDILVSAVSFWELSLKYGLSKLEFIGTSPEQFPGVAASMGFRTLPLTAEDAASFHRLPREAHRDPFDRMLVWQAISARVPLVSKDPDLSAYAPQGLNLFW